MPRRIPQNRSSKVRAAAVWHHDQRRRPGAQPTRRTQMIFLHQRGQRKGVNIEHRPPTEDFHPPKHWLARSRAARRASAQAE